MEVRAAIVDDHVEDRGPLTESEATGLLRRLAAALAAMEELDLIHRDLKPENVVLRGGRPEDPVVVDFGLAKATFDRGVTGELALSGTPGYLPPEVLLAEEHDARSDQFSLGLVARYALTGRDMFPDLAGFELMRRMATGPFPPLPCCSETLKPVLGRMLRLDRDRRFPSARALLEALPSRGDSTPDLSTLAFAA